MPAIPQLPAVSTFQLLQRERGAHLLCHTPAVLGWGSRPRSVLKQGEAAEESCRFAGCISLHNGFNIPLSREAHPPVERIWDVKKKKHMLPGVCNTED